MAGGTLALLLSIAAPEPPPVVAVFPIEGASERLSERLLGQLVDYLSVKLVESGRLRIVPPKQLEAQLRERKAESYATCYDEACQVEIGRELAAQKVLQSRISVLGGECVVTAMLYDLRLAATERAASSKGGCGEAALLSSVDAVAAQLTGLGASPPSPPATASPPAPPATVAAPSTRTFTLTVEATPGDADILLDGATLGRGRASGPVEIGRAYALRVEREGFVASERELRLERDTRLEVELAMTAEYRATRDEWFGASLLGGVTLGGSPLAGVSLRGFGLVFGAFAWTVLEAEIGFGVFRRTTVSTLTTFDAPTSADCQERKNPSICLDDPRLDAYFSGYTRPAVLLALDPDNALELGLGIGFHYLAGSSENDDHYLGPSLGPSIRYLRTSDGLFRYGVGLRAAIPLVPRSCDDMVSLSRLACRAGSPILFQLEVPLGYFD